MMAQNSKPIETAIVSLHVGNKSDKWSVTAILYVGGDGRLRRSGKQPSSEVKPSSTLKAYADGSIVITLALGLTWKNRLKVSEAGSVVLTKAFCLATTNLQDLSSSFLDYI
jgi:hypothetical protein